MSLFKITDGDFRNKFSADNINHAKKIGIAWLKTIHQTENDRGMKLHYIISEKVNNEYVQRISSTIIIPSKLKKQTMELAKMAGKGHIIQW